MSIWEILDPSLTTKKWTVDIGTYAGGHFKSFWFKKNALSWAKKNWDEGAWITLKNEITGRETRLNDPSRKRKDPDCSHEWIVRSPASWWCRKCGAQFNLSCEHGGSRACSDCVKAFIECHSKTEPFENYLAKKSW